MANNHDTLKALFDGIADAIRKKTGSTAKIKADNFPSAINAIESGSGGITPTGTITLIENGKHDVTSYAYAEVAVPTGGGGCDHTEVEQATPSIEVSSDGRITVTSTQKAGLVSGGTKTAEKQLTTIGYKLICPGKDNITVVGAGRYTTGDIVVEGNGNLEPYNIKKGITIFDVTGTLDGADFNVDELSDLHAWYKSTIAESVVETAVTDVLLCNATSVANFQKVDYADSYQIVNNVFSLVNPVNHTLASSPSTLNAINGKYIYSYRTEMYYYIPSDAKVSYKSGTPYHSVTVDKATQLTYTGADGSIVGIVVSENSSAYPHNGTQDGYMYEYIGVLGESGGIELPTLSNPGSESDLAMGKELIDSNGNKVTGNVTDWKEGEIFTSDFSEVVYTNNKIRMSGTCGYPALMRTGAIQRIFAPAEEFGDAEPEQVLAGTYFTSKAGLKVRGTHTEPTVSFANGVLSIR